MDKSINVISNQLENLSFAPSSNLSFHNKSIKNTKTPIKTLLNNNNFNSPSNRKTPGRHRNHNNKENVNHSRKNTPKTPAESGDRFIPNRSQMNFEISHYLMNNSDASISGGENNKSTTMSELIGDLSNYRIMAYQNKPPSPPEGYKNDAKVVYSTSKSTSKSKTSRYISKQPERILDAPDIKNDYYLQLLDWSSNNILAVALNNEVYLWNATDGSITDLLTLEEPDYISSLSWTPGSSNHLAVGLSTGKTQIWDVTKTKRLRSLSNSIQRIGCISWNSHILSNGCKDGHIYNHDVRVAASLVGTLGGHSLEICGLKWSPNKRLLASGGNDNIVNIWTDSQISTTNNNQNNGIETEPLFKLTHHQAAVKALAWCPWRTNCLASGGGTLDRMIRIWNTQTGQCVYTADAKSQVSAILWSDEYKELISSHGYANNELIIWKYPSFNRVAELTGHTARILGMAMSSDGTTVVSLGADETLRFWECFDVDPEKKKKSSIQTSKKKEEISLKFHIR